MKKSSFAAAAVFAAFLNPMTANAAPWAIDKSHSSITFSVEHFGFSFVQGQFRDFDAEIDFDPEDIEATKATFTIDAASFDSDEEARDDHVRTPDFLDVEGHPKIVFTSTSVEKTGDNTAVVTGDMTLRGVTLSVTFDAVLNKIGPSPFNPSQQIAGFSITGQIDRTTFGIETYAPGIGAVIPVAINFEMSPS